MTKLALVVIDVQKAFLDARFSAFGSWEKAFCAPGVEKLLSHARVNEWHIIHVGTRHSSIETLPPHLRRQDTAVYCVEGSPESNFVVSPMHKEEVIFKTGYSAFFRTNLAEMLSAQQIDKVFFTGVAVDCCIQQSVFEGDRLGFQCVVPYQAVAASSSSAYVSGLSAIAKSAGNIVDIGGPAIEERAIVPNKDLESLANKWFEMRSLELQSVEPNDLETSGLPTLLETMSPV